MGANGQKEVEYLRKKIDYKNQVNYINGISKSTFKKIFEFAFEGYVTDVRYTNTDCVVTLNEDLYKESDMIKFKRHFGSPLIRFEFAKITRVA
jgi:hypothetical protein